ncbi:probable disease resistance protein At4g27220 [Magnolia sinica]|uniref:probable disease resistance protein At4g27220 n=1 Tax=Magnolia sinica TaxID=86752 RepID=UPI002659DDB1|nr:probable disease resistance protein At4g27220 [Magnolia sinica]
MAGFRDDDDRRLRRGGKAVSAWSQHMKQQIWDCLRDDEISVFSVWGWNGVGKSRIMRQVVAEAMEEFEESSRLFDIIKRVRFPGFESLAEKMQAVDIQPWHVFTNMTWDASFENSFKTWYARERRNRLMEVQMGIHEALDIPKSMNFYTAANRISEKLSSRKFLFIFEDVWEIIYVEEMGVPVPERTSGSKVVITTRSQEVSSRMGAQVNIMPEEFSEEDAWDFLQEEATDVATSIGFSTGDMVLKCFSYVSLFCQNEGVINGDTLIEEYWRSEGFIDESFNEEENKEATFKRMGNVMLKELVKRCMLQVSLASSNKKDMFSILRSQRFNDKEYHEYIFQGVSALYTEWVQEQITMEGSSGGHYHVYMDSHVRQVIDSRTSLVKYTLDVEESCQWISLSHNQLKTLQFPSPNCPLLTTLLLNNNDRLQQIPDDFFKNMTRLRVLDLSSTSISSLPSSMSCLCELRLLKLRSCRMLETLPTFLKDLQKLEILDLHQTPLMKMEEASFDNMQSLRRLNISGVHNLRRLSLKGCRSLLTLVGLDELLTLEDLDFSVSDASVFESLDQSSKLWTSFFLKFHFLVCPCEGGRKDIYARFKRNRFLYQRVYARFEQSLSYQKRLEVCGGKNSLNGISGVLSVTEFFHLYGNMFIKKLSDLSMEMGNLKECWIEKCHQLECLIIGGTVGVTAVGCLENLRVSDLAMLRTVCWGKLGSASFSRLKHMHLECCPKLIYFFSSRIRLHNLELLEIKFCCRVEKVFEEESLAGQNAFPRLVEFRLWELRKLKSICGGHLPMLKKLKIRGCPMLEKLPLYNTNAFVEEVDIQVCRGELGRGSFACLKHIHLECCPKVINFFSSNIRLQNLELLEIKFCWRLEKVFEEDSVMGQNAFPRLVEFHLWELRKLKSICGGHLPMLKKLKIRGCPMLEKLPLCDTNASAAEVEIQGEQKWWESLKWEGSIKPRNIRFKEWRPSTN